MTDLRSPLARGVAAYRRQRRNFMFGAFMVSIGLLAVAAPLGVYAAIFASAAWEFYLSAFLAGLYGFGSVWAGWHGLDALMELGW